MPSSLPDSSGLPLSRLTFRPATPTLAPPPVSRLERSSDSSAAGTAEGGDAIASAQALCARS